MSEKEKNPSALPTEDTAENEAPVGYVPHEGVEKVEKKRKRYIIQSPYSDYAEDNDLCSEMMNSGEEAPPPDKKQLLKTALTALLTVLMFTVGTFMCVSIFSCVGGGL